MQQEHDATDTTNSNSIQQNNLLFHIKQIVFNKWFIILFIFFLIAGFQIINFFRIQSNESEQLKNINKHLQSDWVLHNDEKRGVKFKYPEEWELAPVNSRWEDYYLLSPDLKIKDKSNLSFDLVSKQGGAMISLRLFRPQIATDSTLEDQFSSNSNNKESIMVNGHEWIHSKSKSPNSNRTYNEYWTIKNERLYLISTAAQANYETHYQEIFDSLVSSVEIYTPKTDTNFYTSSFKKRLYEANNYPSELNNILMQESNNQLTNIRCSDKYFQFGVNNELHTTYEKGNIAKKLSNEKLRSVVNSLTTNGHFPYTGGIILCQTENNLHFVEYNDGKVSHFAQIDEQNNIQEVTKISNPDIDFYLLCDKPLQFTQNNELYIECLEKKGRESRLWLYKVDFDENDHELLQSVSQTN